MAAGVRNYRWTSQPQVPVSVNWSNPLSKSLRVAFTNGINTVNGEIATTIGAVPLTNTTDGRASGPVTSVSDYLRIRSNLSNNNTTISLMNNSSILTYSCGIGTSRIGWAKDYGNGKGLMVPPATMGQYEDSIYIAGQRYSSGPYVAGLFNTLLNCYAVRGDPSDVGFFVNGKKNNAAYYVGGSSDWEPTTTYIDINRCEGTAAYNSSDQIILIALWERLLTDPELASVTTNPWQLFS